MQKRYWLLELDLTAKDKRQKFFSSVAGFVFFTATVLLLFSSCSGSSEKTKKVFYIGRDSTWYPINLRGKEIAMVGFTNDLMEEIGENQGFKPVLFEVGANALLDGLDIGSYDAVISSLTVNSINKEKYFFSDPFYLVGPVLIVRENSKIKSLEDMQSRLLGIESRDLQVYNISEPPNVVIIPYESAAKALVSLDERTVDGVLLGALKAYVWVDGFYAGRLKVVTSPLTNKGFRIVTLKKPEFLKWIGEVNAGLKNVKESGLYDKLIKKWDLINTEVDPTEKKTEEQLKG